LSKRQQRADECAESVVASGRFAGAAVDHELLGLLRYIAIEVVEQHSERRLRLPRAGVQALPSRCANRGEVAAQRLDGCVQRPGDRHGCSFSCARSRSRHRHHEKPVATRKKAAATITARTIPPPVAAATMTTTAASAA